MNKTHEWHILKIGATSLLPFAAIWLLLSFLFGFFNLKLSAGFMATLLYMHALIAIVMYGFFRSFLRGRLTREAIQQRFNKALFFSIIANMIVLGILCLLFGFGDVIAVSPAILGVFLFFFLKKNIPASVKNRTRFVHDSEPVCMDNTKNTMPPLQGLTIDMADPHGLENPLSSNYRHHYLKEE